MAPSVESEEEEQVFEERDKRERDGLTEVRKVHAGRKKGGKKEKRGTNMKYCISFIIQYSHVNLNMSVCYHSKYVSSLLEQEYHFCVITAMKDSCTHS